MENVTVNDDTAKKKSFYSYETVSEFFKTGTGIDTSVILALLNGDSDNPLRQTVINQFNNGLCNKINSKSFVCDATIDENLSSEEQNKLQQIFSDVSIRFTNRVVHSHPFPAASRKLERIVLLNKMIVDLSVTQHRIRVKEVGGDIVKSVMAGEEDIHCCSPILSVYDATRLGRRVYRAKSHLTSGILQKNSQKAILSSYIEKSFSRAKDSYFCFSKSEECDVKADALLLVHSSYDIKLKNLGDIMDKAEALIAYGSMTFHPSIVTDDYGTIPFNSSSFRVERKSGKRKTIYFGFNGCSGFNYEHDYKTYIEYFTKSQFKSSRGSSFSLELLENREGIQFFCVTRLMHYIGNPTTHRLYLTHLKDKYLVRFPFFHYIKINNLVKYPDEACKLKNSDYLKDIEWDRLPDNTEWVQCFVDVDIIDRTCAYVLGAAEERFKPEQIISYLRSITTREVMFNSIVKKKDLPAVDPLAAIAHAIYVTLYHSKYIYGKALQQVISEINSLRDHSNPRNVLKEFDYYTDRGWFRRLWDFLFGNNNGSFNPRQFIIKPADYIEFKYSKGKTTLTSDPAYYLTVDITDLIVIENETAKIAPEMTPPKFVSSKIEERQPSVPAQKSIFSSGVVEGIPLPLADCADFAEDLSYQDWDSDADSCFDDNISIEDDLPLELPEVSFEDYVKAYNDLEALEEDNFKSLKSSVERDRPILVNHAADKLVQIIRDNSISYFTCLDLCSAPGGFSAALKHLNIDCLIDVHYYESDIKLYDFLEKFPGVRIIRTNDIYKGDLLNERDVSYLTSALKGRYDLIVADGCCAEGLESNGTLELIIREFKIARDHLAKGGSLVLKIPLLSSTIAILYEFFRYFRCVRVVKPCSSSPISKEVYLYCEGHRLEGFDREEFADSLRSVLCQRVATLRTLLIPYFPDSDYSSAESDNDHDEEDDDPSNTPVYSFLEKDDVTEIDKLHVPISEIDNVLSEHDIKSSDAERSLNRDKNLYPKRGSICNNYVDVDGSRNECCFLAICEDRDVDVSFLRKRLADVSVMNKDLEYELVPGNFAGSAIIEAFVDHYLVRVVVETSGCNHIFEPRKQHHNTFRTITVRLLNDHYNYKISCRKELPVSRVRHAMFRPFDLLRFVSRLQSVIDVKVLRDFQELTKVSTPGNYFINNLANYCFVHDYCRNNGLRIYVDQLVQKSRLVLNLVLLFETANFDVENFEKLKQDCPNLCFRFLDMNLDGYFTAVVSISSTPTSVSEFKKCFSSFLKHKCGTGRHIQLDSSSNSILTCSDDPTTYHLGVFDKPDLIVELVRDHDLEHHVSNVRLKLGGTGDSSHCDSLPLVLKRVTEFFGAFSPKRYFCIQLVSDFSNVDRLISLLRTRSRFLYVKINGSITYDNSLVVDYLPNSNELNRRRNSMTEVYSLWHYERSVVLNQLKSAYYVLIDVVTNGNALASKIDSTVTLLDLNQMKFVYGSVTDAPYQWGYTDGKLVPTSHLFTKTGKLSSRACNEMRKSYRYIAFNSSSKLIHGITLSSQYSLSDVSNLSEIPITFVQGVPGAGKTQFILQNNVGKSKNLILTVTREAKEDLLKRAKAMGLTLSFDRIKTIDSYLVNGAHYDDIDEVWIDEALLVHCGVWCWVSYISDCRRLVVVGDEAQIPYINRNGLETHYKTPKGWMMDKRFLKTDYRNPLDIVYWLDSKNFYPFDVTGTSSVRNSVSLVKISGPADITISSDVKYLTFTQSEKAGLISHGFKVNTIHEFQGNQADHVALIRTNIKEADSIYESKPHILVALTRHRVSFTYYTVIATDSMSSVVQHISSFTSNNLESVKLSLRAGHEPVVRPDYSKILYLENRVHRNLLLRNDGTSYVSWSFKVEHDFDEDRKEEPEGIEFGSYRELQFFLDHVYPGASTEFREHDHDLFEHSFQPIPLDNVTFDLSLPIYKKYDRLLSRIRSTIQYPLHRSQKLTMKAFFERNGNVPNLQGLIDAADEARRLFLDLKKLFVRPSDFSSLGITFNMDNFTEWLAGQPLAVEKIISAEEAFQDQKFDVYEFILKNVSKIDLELGAEFRYKSPQTIAYQTKTINSCFCPILKELMNRFQYVLHHDILLYNAMSPAQFAQLMTETLPSYRYDVLSRKLEIDFSKYDKSQGLVILILEALVMDYFGVPPFLIKLWVVMHRSTTVVDRVTKFSAQVLYQRKSGDASTWRFNTLVQIAVLNRVLKLWDLTRRDKVVACFSGDDSLIFTQYPFIGIDSSLLRLQQVYNLEAKLINKKVPYFCSKFLMMVDNHWIFVPDTIKLVIKLGRHDLVNYQHVEEYRISFNDNLYYYKFREYWPYISFAINDRYGLLGEHDFIFSALLNISKNPARFSDIYYEFDGFRSVAKNMPLPNLEL